MGKPPLEKARAVVGKLSPEERAALIKQLQAEA
jgi:small ligand-binding sensory domain FIST